MSITRVAFRVHYFAEKLLPTPGSVDINRQTAQLNPKRPQFSFRNWKYAQFPLLGILFLFSVCRLIWLFINFKTSPPMFEIAFYGLVCTAIPATLSFWCTAFVHAPDLYFLVNHASFLGESRMKLLPGQEISFFGFSLMAFLIPLAFFCAPFTIPFDPFQLVFGSHLVVKLVAAFVYFAVAFLSSTGLLCITLMSMSFLETLVIMSTRYRQCKVFCPEGFRKFAHNFKSIKIMCQVADNSVGTSYTHLVMLGICAASLALQCSVRLWGKLHFLTYLGLPFATMACLFAALVFTYFAATPGQNCLRGKQFWRCRTKTLYGRKALKSLGKTGIHLGPYGMVKYELGPRCIDDIINNAVTLLCIEGH